MQAPKQVTVRSVQTLLTGTGIRLVCVLDGHRRVTKGPELKFEQKTAAFRRSCLRLSPALPQNIIYAFGNRVDSTAGSA
jgi:hypothetical protein